MPIPTNLTKSLFNSNILIVFWVKKGRLLGQGDGSLFFRAIFFFFWGLPPRCGGRAVRGCSRPPRGGPSAPTIARPSLIQTRINTHLHIDAGYLSQFRLIVVAIIIVLSAVVLCLGL